MTRVTTTTTSVHDETVRPDWTEQRSLEEEVRTSSEGTTTPAGTTGNHSLPLLWKRTTFRLGVVLVFGRKDDDVST